MMVAGRPCWSMRCAVVGGRLWSLAAAIGLSFDGYFVAGGDEPVDGGLGEHWVAHDGDPFGWISVRGHDRAGL